MLTKNKQNLPLLEITKENYLVPAGEENLYHIRLEVKNFDVHTGERRSHPFLQKFNLIDVEAGMLSLLRQQGYSIDILHDPKEYAKQKAAAMEKAAAEAAEKLAKEKEAAKKEKEAAKKEKDSKETAKKEKESGESELEELS